MIEYQIHDNVDTFDLWIKDPKRKIFATALHIVFEAGVKYDVSVTFILAWLPKQGFKLTDEEAQQLSDELTQHLKIINGGTDHEGRI